MAIVTMTTEEISVYMTPEKEKAENERMVDMPIVYDEDCPPTTPEMARRYRRVNPRKQRA